MVTAIAACFYDASKVPLPAKANERISDDHDEIGSEEEKGFGVSIDIRLRCSPILPDHTPDAFPKAAVEYCLAQLLESHVHVSYRSV